MNDMMQTASIAVCSDDATPIHALIHSAQSVGIFIQMAETVFRVRILDFTFQPFSRGMTVQCAVLHTVLTANLSYF